MHRRIMSTKLTFALVFGFLSVLISNGDSSAQPDGIAPVTSFRVAQADPRKNCVKQGGPCNDSGQCCGNVGPRGENRIGPLYCEVLDSGNFCIPDGTGPKRKR